jgi:hypothetical protein
VTSANEEARRRERAEQVAYWRYQLIRDAADPGLSNRARGCLVRALAATVHKGSASANPLTLRRTRRAISGPRWRRHRTASPL